MFKVIEGDVDPKDVDADYVFDCRGKPNDYSEYDELVNPTNAALLLNQIGILQKHFGVVILQLLMVGHL